MIKNKFCSDCKYYNPTDNFIGKCEKRKDKDAWIDHPACDKFEKEDNIKRISQC